VDKFRDRLKAFVRTHGHPVPGTALHKSFQQALGIIKGGDEAKAERHVQALERLPDLFPNAVKQMTQRRTVTQVPLATGTRPTDPAVTVNNHAATVPETGPVRRRTTHQQALHELIARFNQKPPAPAPEPVPLTVAPKPVDRTNPDLEAAFGGHEAPPIVPLTVAPKAIPTVYPTGRPKRGRLLLNRPTMVPPEVAQVHEIARRLHAGDPTAAAYALHDALMDTGLHHDEETMEALRQPGPHSVHVHPTTGRVWARQFVSRPFPAYIAQSHYPEMQGDTGTVHEAHGPGGHFVVTHHHNHGSARRDMPYSHFYDIRRWGTDTDTGDSYGYPELMTGEELRAHGEGLMPYHDRDAKVAAANRMASRFPPEEPVRLARKPVPASTAPEGAASLFADYIHPAFRGTATAFHTLRLLKRLRQVSARGETAESPHGAPRNLSRIAKAILQGKKTVTDWLGERVNPFKYIGAWFKKVNGDGLGAIPKHLEDFHDRYNAETADRRHQLDRHLYDLIHDVHGQGDHERTDLKIRSIGNRLRTATEGQKRDLTTALDRHLQQRVGPADMVRHATGDDWHREVLHSVDRLHQYALDRQMLRDDAAEKRRSRIVGPAPERAGTVGWKEWFMGAGGLAPKRSDPMRLSRNVTTSASLGHALRELGSRNQQAREEAARRLLRESGERGTVASVLAHHPERGFRPSVLAALAVGDEYAREASRYLGAWHGSLTQEPDTVAFHTHPEGTDKMHVLHTSAGPEQLARVLNAAGVQRFALRPGPTRTTAFVYDHGGMYDLNPLAARLPNGSANHTAGTGQRLGQGAGAHDDGSVPHDSYREHIRAVEGGGTGAPERVHLARLKPGAIRAADLKTWQKVLAAVPEDGVRRGVLADWLEERGHHHSQADLDRLRSHEGPLFVTRHPVSKRVVAVPGTPVRTVGDLNERREAHGHGRVNTGPDTAFGLLDHTPVFHGPGGIAVVMPYRAHGTWGRADLDHTGRYLAGTSFAYPHATEREALAAAHSHAFPDTHNS